MLGFDPLQFPLHGQRLIEASAGTGKTYSIAFLFLRLILEKKLDVDQVLVVTFTTAATEELRSRICARLREALDLLDRLDGAGEPAGGDGLLARLLSRIDGMEDARMRLADALARMDEAAVYTIHGFCQRMLQDNAFESGALFALEFLESEKSLRSQIIEDFWRMRFYGCPAEESEWALSEWGGPDGLAKSTAGLLAKPFVEYVPAVSPNAVQEKKEAALEHYRLVCLNWRGYGAEVENILRTDKCLSRSKKEGYSPARIDFALSWMQAQQDDSVMRWVLPRGLELLSREFMQGKLIGKKICPSHPFFDQFGDFTKVHADFVQSARFHVLAEAGKFLRDELHNRKDRQGRIFFDDLLIKVDQALSGRDAANFTQRVRGRFAAALIDEFQDTDPRQYRIVSRLFGTGPNPALFMIGDPKQSIYSFRGADIFTYIRARRDTPAEGRFTMGTNYRSTAGMVRAVNTLFQAKNSFIFDPDIVFHRVEAGGKADEEPLRLDGRTVSPLQAMLIRPEGDTGGAELVTKTRAEDVATAWTAHEIARLINLGACGSATVGERSLCGGDLAVLVRTHLEAGLMQRALSSLRIASVYYSQDSVFTTDEALQLCQVLSALLDPSREGPVQAALLSDLFGMDGYDLYRLQKDDAAREKIFGEMQDYAACWKKNGLMAMFQMMLVRRKVVQRLSAGPSGERKLTNYLHLVELLQEASLKREGQDSLIRWYADQMQDPEPDLANQQLRLESDENLVRIITIHKAKGLEYPVVFLPYLWRARTVARDRLFSFHEPGSEKVLADLGTGNAEHYRLAERERLAEDLRLLYVAMTRARHMCSFCWGHIKGADLTALAWLLYKNGVGGEDSAVAMNGEQVQERLAGLNNPVRILDFVEYPESFPAVSAARQAGGATPAAKVFSGRIDSGWAITSYSQLTAAQESPEQMEGQVSLAARPVGAEGNERTKFTFPRGANAGSCLHSLLEHVDFAVMQEHEVRALVENQLARSGIAGEWTEVVHGWLREIVQTPLDRGKSVRLIDIDRGSRLVELGFYFSLHEFDIRKINRLLAEYSLAPLDVRPGLVRGLMKGFIDLVFHKDGRYFIADYKSNYLGPSCDDYQVQSLAEAISEHRYDLQYLIYTLALHRYLGSRLAGYRYDRDFGGVYYLFLRGMDPEKGPGSGVFFTLPPQDLVKRLDLCFGRPEEE